MIKTDQMYCMRAMFMSYTNLKMQNECTGRMSSVIDAQNVRVTHGRTPGARFWLIAFASFSVSFAYIYLHLFEQL